MVGYSGENDPVFDHLARVPRFDNKLYWVSYKDKDNEPAEHVCQRLLVDGKYAFYVKGFDADYFFVTLAQRLNSFPPDFISKPFSHLDSLLEMVTPYTLPGQTTQVDVTDEARKLIRTAINTYENVKNAQSLAQTYFLKGNYDEVIALLPKNAQAISLELIKLTSWAYIMQGNSLFKQAKTKTGKEAECLYAQAVENYQAAIKLKPDDHEALNNCGIALSAQAETKTGEEADRLFALAGEKYQAALKIKPDMYEALNNWGFSLSERARTKTGNDADQLFTLAGERYQVALKLKPDNHEALNNWGNAITSTSGKRSGLRKSP